MAYGLSSDTLYYYRTCGVDYNYPGHPMVDGNIVSFRTDADSTPSGDNLDIDTYSATNIDEDSAKLKGRVSGANNVRT